MLTLGKRIYLLRTQQRMTQTQFEQKTGIKRSYLSKIENDELKNPTYKTLMTIAKGLDVKFSTLVDGESDNTEVVYKHKISRLEQEVEDYQSILHKIVNEVGAALEAKR